MSPDEFHGQFTQSVGAKMRAVRLARKLTQNQLARPDFSVSYISAIEREQIQPSLRALAILAARLGLSSTQLLTGQTSDDVIRSAALNKLSPGEEEVELMLVEAQIAIRQGAALRALEQLQQVATRNLKRRRQVQLQYLLGWAYLHTAQFEESKHALLEAARLAKDQSDSSINVCILNMLGTVYAATGNYTDALGAYQRCLDLLASDQQYNPFFTLQVYTNLGECYSRIRQFGRAVEMFQRAAAFAEELTAPGQLTAQYEKMYQHYSEAGEDHLAALGAYKCLYLYGQASRLLARSTLYYQLCRAVMRGDQEEARRFLDAALEREREGQDRLSVAGITVHLAMWFLAHKAVAEAKEYAQKAYEEAQPFGDSLIAAEALLLLGDIAYAGSQYEEGDACFAAGLAMLERLGMREELAEGLVHYSQLLENGGRLEEALRYLKRAFEIRQM